MLKAFKGAKEAAAKHFVAVSTRSPSAPSGNIGFSPGGIMKFRTVNSRSASFVTTLATEPTRFPVIGEINVPP